VRWGWVVAASRRRLVALGATLFTADAAVRRQQRRAQNLEHCKRPLERQTHTTTMTS
jgi:hypothetical protein